jgi:glycosyltransferase involved in cell wall biosynthesis
MIKKIYILHSFNGRPYFEAVEYLAKKNNMEVEYKETNCFKSIVKFLLRKKCVNCDLNSIINNILFFLKIPFMKDEIIIYGTGPYDFRFLYYSILRKKNNFIYHTSHHKWENDEKSVFLYGPFSKLLKKYWFNILKSKNVKILAVTKESKKTLENELSINKINQIYHSINFNKFYQVNKNYFNKKLKVLFVGRFVYEKGLDILMEVIEKIDSNKFDFTIVGDGNYKNKISSVFEKDNVNYLGWISDKDEIASIFKEQDVLLNPSIRYKDWEELFGLVNIEAMAAGNVVIASNHIGPREIINDKINGFLVEEKKSDEIIQILNKLYEDRNYLKFISENAIKRAKDFDIKKISEKWEKVIYG